MTTIKKKCWVIVYYGNKVFHPAEVDAVIYERKEDAIEVSDDVFPATISYRLPTPKKKSKTTKR